MSCVHWLKADGVCKHCGYTQRAPSLGLAPRPYRDEEKPEPKPDPLRAALVAIQELHKPVWVTYLGVPGLVCDACREPVESEPCETRRLADAGLGGGQDG